MPISVHYNNDDLQICVIRPAPLVSISSTINKTGGGEAFGTTYSITLTGTLLDDQGFPLAKDVHGAYFPYSNGVNPSGSPSVVVGPYGTFDMATSHADYNRPLEQNVPWNFKLDAIFSKQKSLRTLFARDGQRLDIVPVHGDEPAIVCYPRVVSVNFTEGIYVNKCDYTIELEADTLLNKNLEVDNNANPLFVNTDINANKYQGLTTEELIILEGRFIQSLSESWSIETADDLGETISLPNGKEIIRPRSYRISHSMSATGKTHYYPEVVTTGPGSINVIKLEAWEQARDYVQLTLMPPASGSVFVGTDVRNYPNVMNQIGSGTLNLISSYRGFNHVRTEDANVSDGSYSVTENWVIASGTAYENYTMSIKSDTSAPFVSVGIDGTIKGLSEVLSSGVEYGGAGSLSAAQYGDTLPYANASKKFREISNEGRYGLASNVYKRANNMVAVQLNTQPNSISLGTNEFTGEITYALEFDNRPTNIISGVLSETISVNDTYPGDVFAVIPVIGRETGPILQYIGGRSEYRRDVTIELGLDYTDVPYGSGRASLLVKKPSIIEPTRTQLRNLVNELSPAHEPGIRKYFINAPTESWNPKTGSYNFTISWTYELDK